MLLTITAYSDTQLLPDTRDIGFLLHKNPDTLFEKGLPFGQARVFYPEATPERTTIALLLEIDPIHLVRGQAESLFQYVCDRPYVASSFLSVALSACFSTALAGRSKERTELLTTPLPLSATLAPLACEGGEPLIRRLWEPLGYTVATERAPLDPTFPEWGESKLYTVTLTGRQTVHDLLSHLYVLVPALDNAKHYFVGDEEVEKLLRHGETWLAGHPAKEQIAQRYLRYRRTLTASALARLAEVEGSETASDDPAERTDGEHTLEQPVRLSEHRIEAALDAVRTLEPPATRILDLGCGEGNTLRALRSAFPTAQLTGMDVSSFALTLAARRLKYDPQNPRLTLLLGSLVYRDQRLRGFDLALLMEVIEHLDPDRLAALETNVFGDARPRRLLVTTPNAEYNSVWAKLPAGKLRHPDHRFEWDRAEFAAWAERVAQAHGYTVTLGGIGTDDPEGKGRGTPTQSALFDRIATP